MAVLRPNHVYQGDCIEKLKAIKPGSVDLVFADPPFNIGYDYDIYDDDRSTSEYLSWSQNWMSAVRKALKPSGTFWLAIGDEYAAELKVLAQDKVGFSCRSWVIWYYTFGVNCVKGFSRSHTHLFHFVKNPESFTFNGRNPAVRVLSARQLVYADGRANSKGRLPDNTWILRPQDHPDESFQPEDDTWFFSRIAGTFKERAGFHGCQMPEQLLGRIIRVSSNPRDLVLDPFAGSGTTLVVAKKLGRRWLGTELSRDYVSAIQSRLQTCRTGDSLDGPREGSRSAPKTSQGKRKVRLLRGRPVPTADPETEQGIIDAYVAACKGRSTDFVLCDPELNSRFVAACKKKALLGDAYTWNRLLLRIRKRGDLPGISRHRVRLSRAQMDSFSFASEIAMQLLSIDFGLTLDDILCSPLAAAKFDELASEFADGHTEFEYRWAAMVVRKRAKKSKTLARERFENWLTDDLADPVPLERCTAVEYQHTGVYVVFSHDQPLYVGETLDVSARVQQVLDTESWQQLEPTSVQVVVPRSDLETRYGVQSILIQRTNPLFNSRLLRPSRKPATSHLEKTGC